MLYRLAKKIFGTRNDRVIHGLSALVRRINELEPEMKARSDADLAALTPALRKRFGEGESLDDLLPEAFAAVREASVRTLGMRHFDVQLIGGMVLHRGMIAEMKTGEGKTLMATLAAYLNALPAKGVHIVTVNDYLARRDAEWMGRIYKFLGMSVGVVFHGMDEEAKRLAYNSDITYGQNNEFGFDYLRDNMKFNLADQFQRGHYFAIVDEVDSILIDEARTPLIISGPAEDATDLYYKVDKIIPRLEKTAHFEIDLRTKQPTLTEDGVARAEQLLGVENLYDPSNIEILHHVVQALKAHTTMERDVDYVVKEGQIIIVDEFTGRLMPGRRWSDGLHQAIEAKESLKIARENQTLASITFQNYFRMYEKLSGMTGTADTEAVEFKSIYKLDVVVIPTNRPMVRLDESDQVFKTRREKYDAVVRDIVEINQTGQPVLVGTISIEQSEALAKVLAKQNIPHNVLNAKQHEREAEIVAQAGRHGAVTISTNMAGRGTDIVLGGNAEFLAAAEAGTKERADPVFLEAFNKYREICASEREKVVEAGGLFIMGTERHESRRIDNQLRGRSGRQGDPGKSRFYVSLEDDLMMRFGGDRIQGIMEKLGWEEGMAIEGGMISRRIEAAQKRVEAFHFDNRKHVTEYDDVMNKQRQVVYNLRGKLLAKEGIRGEVSNMMDDLLEENVIQTCDERAKPMDWDLSKIEQRFEFLFKRKAPSPSDLQLDQQSVYDWVRKEAHAIYDAKMLDLEQKLETLRGLFAQNGADGAGRNPFDFTPAEVEQETLLRTLDHLWLVHLQQMDHLREGVGLRGYGQKNPLHEYQREGFLLFQSMIENLKETVVRQLFYYELPDAQEYLAHLQAERARREAVERQMRMVHDAVLADAQSEGGGGAANQAQQAAAQTPDDARAKLEAQRKARRKARR
jgi:preprotein translocase subunit SecA